MVLHAFHDSNHDRGPDTHVIRFLERNGIPYHYLHTTKENKREEEILDLVQNTDFLVLARYMQVNMMIRSIVPLLLTSCMPN
jgi:formyltetrahydrofolate hydrolase